MSSLSSTERTRRWFLGRSAAVAATAMAAACGSDADDRPTGAGSTVSSEEYRYGDHPSQVVDLRLPSGRPDGSWPVVVLIHGGFWRAGYDRSLMDRLVDDVAGRGFATWNVDYRASGEGGGGWPATFTDVAAAVDLLADAAGDHPLHTGRVATVGHSAGGTLALWAAARPGLPAGAPGSGPLVTVHAAISLAGVVDLRAAWAEGLGGGAVAALMGGSPDDSEPLDEAYRLASPLDRFPIGVTQVLVHGSSDTHVPPHQSTDYGATAKAAGDDVEVALLDGADHFDVIDPAHPAWHAVVDRLERLLA